MTSQPPTTGVAPPTLQALFAGFFFVGINGFGGVMPFARRMIVDQRRWLSTEEFLDALSICQFLPGPNIVNLAVVLGARFCGPAGALAAVIGILAAPMAIAIAAYSLIGSLTDAPRVIGALHGLSAAAAGLVAAMALRLAVPMLRRRDLWAIAMATLAIGAVALLRLPLVITLLALAPLAIAGERLRRR